MGKNMNFSRLGKAGGGLSPGKFPFREIRCPRSEGGAGPGGFP